MDKSDSVMDFATKFTTIVSDLQRLGETLSVMDVVTWFLRATPAKFDPLTLSLKQYGDLSKITLDEVIGSLSIHELRLKEREAREEEQALLARALSKTTLTAEASSSRGRGRGRGRCGRRGKGCGRSRTPPADEGKVQYDKSQISCYNGQKFGHFAYECRSAKKERSEQAYVVEVTDKPDSTLLMVITGEACDVLLQGSAAEPSDPDLWYLDTGATNHMSGNRSFFADLDGEASGIVKFGDNSTVQIAGRGTIHVNWGDGHIVKLGKALYVPKLCANILSLGRLHEEGCRMVMYGGSLTIFDQDGEVFAEVKRTEGRLYLHKLHVVDQCLV
ncbi:uncharacterized protein LOC144716389 [Wolffia australiana]